MTMSRACKKCPENSSDCYEDHCIEGDGIPRAIQTVNKKMPGPSIEVCKGDTIVVDVNNRMMSESTTFHWHGLQMNNSNYMDGVPQVTQCPILPDTTFRYVVEANKAGTFFWHSHSGVQRGDGLIGALIVRESLNEDPHSSLYDFDLYEHVLIIQEWFHNSMASSFVEFHYKSPIGVLKNFLINGMGRFSGSQINVPYEEFFVESNKTYRFRIINAGAIGCPVELTIDGHNFTVIASDGNNIEPIEVNSLITHSGERYDILVRTDRPAGNYWIHVSSTLWLCKHANQKAILRYDETNEMEDLPKVLAQEDQKVQLNSIGNGVIPVIELKSINDPNKNLLKKSPDNKFFIYFDNYPKENPQMIDKKVLMPQLNHITNALPSIPIILDRNHHHFCNDTFLAENKINCKTDFCDCTHVLQVELGSMVEVVLIDEGYHTKGDHPFHLHGHSFWVIGMGKLEGNITVEGVSLKI